MKDSAETALPFSRLTFVVALVIGFTAGWSLLGTQQSQAVTCNLHVGVAVKPDTNGRGVRFAAPGMRIWDDNVECARVSSLQIFNSAETRFVEVGWYEDQNNIDCLPTAGGPRRLGFAFDDGLFWCFPASSSISTGQKSFAVEDINQNGVWQYWHAGTNFWGSPDMGSFVTGIINNNGERFGSQDSAKADFDGLQRMGPSGSWSPWHTPTLKIDTDPTYNFCFFSETHTSVDIC